MRLLLANFIRFIGRYATRGTGHLFGMLGFLGRVVTDMPGVLAGKNRPRHAVVVEVDAMGVHSLPLVFMASVTIAISSVVLSLEQLSAFGGLTLVSFFTTKIILREAAPLIVGIVLTVKAGSHVVMRISRTASGPFPGTEGASRRNAARLLTPSVLGMFIVAPALYLMSVVLCVLAGVISQSFGSIENFRLFFDSFLYYMMPADLAFGMIKTLAFGFTIVFVCGYMGYETTPDAETVGKSVLAGIMTSYIAILTLNVLFVYGYGLSQLMPGV